jgi:nitrite reductase/ring-hydroxylating ferredoxin subunit/uncharacterized membrane protein
MARTRPALSPLNHLHHWLEGRPFGHPLHPLFVHLPIGLWTLSFLFDLASRVLTPQTWLVQGAFYTLALGLVTAIVAALFGVVDWVDIRADHPAHKLATTHMLLNLVAMAFYLVNGWLRLGTPDAAQTPFGPLALSFIALAVLYVSGYLGGRLVYDEGIGVGRHRRQGELPEETIRAPQPRRPGEFVPVVYTQRLNNAEAVRVEVNGYAIALARVGDEYYAVQDNCTHRYGPLSEGRLCEGEVECPWHRSRFDLRTGQPTHGPAKEPLKTFETRVVDGIVQVRVPAEPPSHEQAEEAAQAAPRSQREGTQQREA